ncbi:hypothetical protein BX666DRAFT_1948531 [Dichotomocladium elegans]|nr:hypothetical protein BX666DRAFT_1948531 [Dichotomocladium elegans]
MVSLWWGQSALREQIENATSELLPANQEDIALHFMISDQIRGKKVNAKDAMRALKCRMEHKNPNVQLATLSLTDTCVKNAGDQFVREIASREFMETLSSILHAPDCNLDVKNKILSVVQTWALAAKNNPNLSYLTDTYQLLQYERFRFPPVKEHINALLLETAAPPEWTDSDVCERCRTPFTFTNRKHHCRNCGGTFCQECSSKSLALPHLAIDETVRVCYGCYIKLKTARISKKDRDHSHQQQQGPASSQSIPPLTRTPTTAVPATAQSPLKQRTESEEEKRFEEDMKKAIELSKKEAEYCNQHLSAMSNEVNKADQKAHYEKGPLPNDEIGEDVDLAAAIAASLRDMENAQKTELEYYNIHRPAVKPIKDELTAVEMENIELFATLMTQISASGDKAIYDDQVNQLYTQIGTLQQKLVNNLNEASQKQKKFADLHEKLINAVRTYDHLLEVRIAGSCQQSSRTGPYYGAPTSLPYQNTAINGMYMLPSAVRAVSPSQPLPPPPPPQLHPQSQQPSYIEQQTAGIPPKNQNMHPPDNIGINKLAPYSYPPTSCPAPTPTACNLRMPAVGYTSLEQHQQSTGPQTPLGDQAPRNYNENNVKQWESQQQQHGPIYPPMTIHNPQNHTTQPNTAAAEDALLIEL